MRNSVRRAIHHRSTAKAVIGSASSLPRFDHSSSGGSSTNILPVDVEVLIGCSMDLLGVFAEFETNLRKERQLEGVARAKLLGKYKGRKSSVPTAEVRGGGGHALGDGPPARDFLRRHRNARYTW
jgi:hypothetical protein